MSQKLLKTTSKMSRQDAAEKLHNLADNLSEGKVELKAGNESVKLQTAEQVEFELEVEKEDNGDKSIEIEIEWPETANKEEIEIH